MSARRTPPARTRRRAPTEAEIRALGVRAGAVDAGWALGYGRTTTFALIRRGEFPVPVLRLANKYVVPMAPVLKILGLGEDAPQASANAAA